jgi:A/G-specific adenine glycosylase
LASLYPTVVSEFMLQQTQVKTVLPYYASWLKVFPDFETLATASEATVLKHWEGLGYYSRARNLHKLAQEIIQLEAIPQDANGWQQFKGIGAYTAAAITSITFKNPVPCVDGNVIRILARLTADETLYNNNTKAMKAFTPLAEVLLDKEEPGHHNEAMMELGATLCTKANPQCSICPINSGCRAKGNQPERFPMKTPKKVKQETIHRAWLIKDDHLLLHRANGASKRLTGILELPRLEDLNLSDNKLSDFGQSPAATKRRGISNSQITEPIWKISESHLFEKNDELEWVALNELGNATLSGPHKRWIKEILNEKQLSWL